MTTSVCGRTLYHGGANDRFLRADNAPGSKRTGRGEEKGSVGDGVATVEIVKIDGPSCKTLTSECSSVKLVPT